MTVDKTISFKMGTITRDYVPDFVVALWEGPQLLLAKVKNADGQDWYIYSFK